MVQSVELLLDDAADAAVRRLWRALADAGLPSQARHGGASNRPHVTLSAHPWLPAGLDDALGDAVGPLPRTLELDGLLVFAHRTSVLALAVVGSPGLRERQAAVLAAVRAAGGPDPLGEHLHPDLWTPHVTLGHRLSDEDVDTARNLLAGDLPAGADAVVARRWDGDERLTWDLPRVSAGG